MTHIFPGEDWKTGWRFAAPIDRLSDSSFDRVCEWASQFAAIAWIDFDGESFVFWGRLTPPSPAFSEIGLTVTHVVTIDDLVGITTRPSLPSSRVVYTDASTTLPWRPK